MLFEWGVAVHDLDFDAIRSGEKSKEQVRKELKGIAGKARLQIQKDYIAWPALSGLATTALDLALNARRIRDGEPSGRLAALRGRLARARPRRSARKRMLDDARPVAASGFLGAYRSALWANVAANIIRNLWAHSIIFCGHFPDQTYTFSQEEVEDESRGGWYVRQLLGAANIEGGAFFHVASGNLGYQVEHHLYPDMPSTRYAEIAPRVKEICERYGLPYNSGPLSKQLGMVHRTIIRLAFPGGKPRPKPGPYRGTDTAESSSNGHARSAPPGPDGSGPEQRSEGVRVSMPDDR
jgi:NADPH-dependent stearoyl-CoA 9-desaturase